MGVLAGAVETVTELARVSGLLGLEFPVENWSKITQVLELMEEYSRSMNLSGARDRAALTIHAVEALLPLTVVARLAPPVVRWLDVGSGGGFPGLLVAALTHHALTMVEPRARHAAFLEFALARLGRGDVMVRRVRLARGGCQVLDGEPPLRKDFTVADARAVMSPEEWLKESRAWLADGGFSLLHVGIAACPSAGLVGRASWGRWRVDAYKRTPLVPRGTSDLPSWDGS